MDVVPGGTGGASLGVSAVGVSSVGGELNTNNFTVEGHRPHGITNIVMPMNISVVNDELDPNEVSWKYALRNAIQSIPFEHFRLKRRYPVPNTSLALMQWRRLKRVHQMTLRKHRVICF